MDQETYYEYTPKKSFFENLSSHIIDFIQTFVVFGAIFALIYLFVAQFHKVSGQSMFPTMHNGDFLITEKISYRLGDPKHGQIVVLKNPREESQDFIKRIIAIPGDTIRLENNAIFLNGGLLNEPYLPPGTPTRGESFLREGNTFTVPSNQYFVIGDNREHSSDSREFGPVGREKLIGRGLFRYWPPQSVGLLILK
ncbi:MAG: signal peptidase I [Microgenomates group bacterium Gr01-1014_7]|nr:MAG: signal peptidase I [Microgenomates group bacterium Gr01-1014_7]